MRDRYWIESPKAIDVDIGLAAGSCVWPFLKLFFLLKLIGNESHVSRLTHDTTNASPNRLRNPGKGAIF